MIRLLDIFFSILILLLILPLFFLIFLFGLFDTGSPLFFQKRVGIHLKSFILIKFRTMKLETPLNATHLVDKSNITFFGNLIRKYKIDELPQLLNVLMGDMSLVGPRPCLFNQSKLISERKKRRVFKVRPGITGLAQVAGITMKTPTLLAKTDLKMIEQMNLFYYFYYILITILLIFRKEK
jgi:lipopolysaccharide/colanic/teichoic acid biosynthesis glycosyltransferase